MEIKNYLVFSCFLNMVFFVNAQNVKGRVYFWNPRSGASQQFEKQKYSNELSFEYSNFVGLSNILKSIPDTFEMAAIDDDNLRKIPVELYNFCHVKGLNINAPHVNKIDSNIIGMKDLVELIFFCDSLMEIPSSISELENLMVLVVQAKFVNKELRKKARVIVKKTKSKYLAIALGSHFQIDTIKTYVDE